MGYELMLRPRGRALSEDAFVAHFNERENVTFPEDAPNVAAYRNLDTGVHFHFEHAPPDIEEALGALTFHVNLVRPHVFALEAAQELRAVVEALDLVVDDPQAQGVDGPRFEGDALLRGWRAANRAAYGAVFSMIAREEANASSAIARVEAEAEGMKARALPSKTLERLWRFNVEAEALRADNGGYYEVPRVGFVERGDRLGTFVDVDITRGFLLPQVDVVYVTRPDGEGAVVPWDEVASTLALKRGAAIDDPWRYWAVSTIQASRLARHLRSASEPLRDTLGFDEVHTAEDVEAGAEATLRALAPGDDAKLLHLERYTSDAKAVVARAQALADRRRDRFVTPLHVLCEFVEIHRAALTAGGADVPSLLRRLEASLGDEGTADDESCLDRTTLRCLARAESIAQGAVSAPRLFAACLVESPEFAQLVQDVGLPPELAVASHTEALLN